MASAVTLTSGADHPSYGAKRAVAILASGQLNDAFVDLGLGSDRPCGAYFEIEMRGGCGAVRGRRPRGDPHRDQGVIGLNVSGTRGCRCELNMYRAYTSVRSPTPQQPRESNIILLDN